MIERAVATVPHISTISGLDQAYFRLGWLYQVPGSDPERAIAMYDKVIIISKDASAYNNRAVARAASGDLAGAINDYDQAIMHDPKSAKAYNNRAIARAAKGDLKGAINDCGAAIALDPQNASALTNRGRARYQLGDLEGAIRDYNQAITLDAQNAAAYFSRGIAYQKQDKLTQAIEDFEKTLKYSTDITLHNAAEERLRDLQREKPGSS